MALGQEELGRRIRQAREDANLTQRELADAIGLQDAQSVSNYERGVTEVSTRRLRRIAEATKKPLPFFLGPDENGHALAGESDWRIEVLDRMRALEEQEERHGELLHELLRLARGDEGSAQADVE